MRIRAAVFLLSLSLIAASALSAPPSGTPTEAKAMLQKAVAHYKSVGRTQALADFSAGKAPFRDRDLFVMCVGPDGLFSANGAYGQYVGTRADTLTDASGQPL